MITYALKTSAPLLLYFIVQRNGSGRARATSSRAAMEREEQKKCKRETPTTPGASYGNRIFRNSFLPDSPAQTGVVRQELELFRASAHDEKQTSTCEHFVVIFLTVAQKASRIIFFVYALNCHWSGEIHGCTNV